MGDFSHPDLLWNLQLMIMMDWMGAQAEDKTIGEIIERYKSKNCKKGKDTDSQGMKKNS